LIFKHAISTVVSGRAGMHLDLRPEKAEGRSASSQQGHGSSSVSASDGVAMADR